jgi:FixJ family two-component response regulator
MAGSSRRSDQHEGKLIMELEGADSMTAGASAASVHVIDDDDGFRRSMTRMLTAAGFTAAGYRCATEFLQSYERSGSVCILLDISMPGPSGIDILEAMVKRECAPPVIFVTARDDVLTTIDVMKSGAFSYLLKPVQPEKLLSVVRAALRVDETRRAMEEDRSAMQARFATLSATECAIFHGVVNDRLNKQLAIELGVCERTIKTQRSRMMAKLNVQTVPQLVRMAKLLHDTVARDVEALSS